jgi:hypothetical protein
MATPTGAPHEATAEIEIKAFCRDLFARPAYQARIRQQWDAGTLPPALETLLLHYAFGKPAPTVAPPVDGFDPAKYLARLSSDINDARGTPDRDDAAPLA